MNEMLDDIVEYVPGWLRGVLAWIAVSAMIAFVLIYACTGGFILGDAVGDVLIHYVFGV